MLSEELVDIATRHQVYLERFKAGELRRTDALFAKLSRDLLAALNRLPDANLGVLTVLERERLVDAIMQGQVEAYRAHMEALILQLRLLADFEREFELRSVNEVTEDTVEADDGQDDRGAAMWLDVQNTPMTATGKVLAGWLGAWLSFETTRAGDLVRRAVGEGWTVSRLATAFQGTRVQGYRDGLAGSAKRNTRTVINTAVQHVASVARRFTMERIALKPAGAQGRLPIDEQGRVRVIPSTMQAAAAAARIRPGDKVTLMGYRWVSVLDDRTSQRCRSLDGQVFRFGEGPLPPAHANCRSSIVAEPVGRWLKRMPSAGRRGMSYYEWLRTQPEAFQNDALGVTRATLFRKGGLSAEQFARLNLGRNFEPLTLEEMRRLAPNAFERAGI